MSGIELREPANDDWPAILTLAELSLAELPVIPSQQEWLNNRRSFTSSDGIQQHFVATSGEHIVGYACIEHRNETKHGTKPADGVYRLFVVVAPSARRTLGTQLLAKLRESLVDLGARRAWVVEYEADAGFLAYLEQMGFVRLTTFKLDDGTPVVELSIDAPFQSLARRDFKKDR
jgi:N-acetylglutamate synthase-like GNAT family acetyltransferase